MVHRPKGCTGALYFRCKLICVGAKFFVIFCTVINVGLNITLTFNSLMPSDAYMCQKTNHHWFRQWLVAWPAPSHYLNQCWNIVNWTLINKLQWNLNWNSNISTQENEFENVVWKMTAICLGLNVLTNVPAAKLWRHLSNMNVVCKSDMLFCNVMNFHSGEINEQGFSNHHLNFSNSNIMWRIQESTQENLGSFITDPLYHYVVPKRRPISLIRFLRSILLL